MKYKAIILEDESLARKRLKLLLQKHRDVIEIIDEAENGFVGLEKINEHKPDLIFLDIQMPGLTGFEMLKHLDEMPLVIFTTAYDEYALNAFETKAIDYLLKPITPERMAQAISKLLNITGNIKEQEKKILNLINNLKTSENAYIKVKSGTVTRLVNYQDIFFLQAEDKYTCLHTQENKYYINESLSEMEILLPTQFRRIHRGTIINLDHVKEIIHLSYKQSVVIMKDKQSSELMISRRMKKNLQ